LHIKKERFWGLGKKIKPSRNDDFEVLEGVGDSTCKLSLPPYMHIYSIINRENLNLYEPTMFNEDERGQFLPSIEDLAEHAHA
jgi:hypothetical protein